MKTLRILLSLLLSAAIICGMAAAVDTPTTTDNADVRRADAINCMVSCGFLRGNGVDLGLEDRLTRAEAAVLLVRLCGAEDISLRSSPAPFTDVPAWAASAVNYLWSHGAVKGVGNGLYGSGNALTARDFTVMLLRMLGYQESAGDFVYPDALGFAKQIGMYNDAEYEWLTTHTYNRAGACYAAYQMLNQIPKGGNTPYAYTVVEDIRASYNRTCAEIICGDNPVYNALSAALDSLDAEDSYTLTQSAFYSHIGPGAEEKTKQTMVYRRDNLQNLSSIHSTQDSRSNGENAVQRIRIFATDTGLCQSEDNGGWAILDYLPAALLTRCHTIPRHLFSPTPSLCESSEVSADGNGRVVITGFSCLSQLIGDITSAVSTDYFYDFTIVIDPDTDRILSVSVKYQDVWKENNTHIDILYQVEYTFSDYGCTDVWKNMDGLKEIID